jgi:hypothetical protein
MRFRGGGVGHKSTREATNFFKKDRDRLDTTHSNAGPGNDDEEDSEMPVDEEGVDDVNEDEEDDFGYVREESDDSEAEQVAENEDGDDDFGPEDDGGLLDTDMMTRSELGYGDL